MKWKLALLAAVGTVAAVNASPAAAAFAWTARPGTIDRMVAAHWNTPDGQHIISATCRGTGGWAHNHGGYWYHRFNCTADDVHDREFRFHVTVTGPARIRVVSVACDDSQSDWTCP